VRRLLWMVLVLVLVSALIFALVRLIPGDPALVMLGASSDASPEVLARLRQQLGLDQPLPVQYALWLGRVLRGDLGESARGGQPVLLLLVQRLPVTLELAGLSLLLGTAVAVPAGIVAARYRNLWVDRVVTAASLGGLSLPGFVLALGMIYYLSLQWRWLPPTGYVNFFQDPAQNLKLMAMPALSLGLASAGMMTRLLRSQMLDVLHQDYVRTARAKGLGDLLVVAGHGLRNALIPFVTVIGQQAGVLLSGAVITETVFALPGMGRLVVDNVVNRDLAVVQGAVLWSALIFLVVNLAVDLLYVALDPRVRLA